MKKYLILMVGLVAFLSSCDRGRVIDDNISLSGQAWEKTYKADFEVSIDDTASNYRFFVNVRNSVDYRYSNLYIFLNTRFPNGNVTRDTIECLLADPTGKWLGRGMSKIRENQILLNASLRFPLKGVYRFEIEQAMREESLQGISDIGIRIQKTI